jgi:hypothetical protein
MNGGEAVGIHVETEPFDHKQMPDNIGLVWVSLCGAINQHMRSRGAAYFDCLHANTVS